MYAGVRKKTIYVRGKNFPFLVCCKQVKETKCLTEEGEKEHCVFLFAIGEVCRCVFVVHFNKILFLILICDCNH